MTDPQSWYRHTENIFKQRFYSQLSLLTDNQAEEFDLCFLKSNKYNKFYSLEHFIRESLALHRFFNAKQYL